MSSFAEFDKYYYVSALQAVKTNFIPANNDRLFEIRHRDDLPHIMRQMSGEQFIQ